MKTDSYTLLLVALATYLAAALVVPWLASRRHLAAWCQFALISAAAVLLTWSAGSAWTAMTSGPSHAHHVDLGALELALLVDGLSAFFLVLIGLMGGVAALYSVRYLDHYQEYRLGPYFACFPLFLAGMAAVVTVDDLSLGFTAAWQTMTISSFLLIRFEHRERRNVRAANKYLVLMELAWLAVVTVNFVLPGVEIGDNLHTVTAALAGAPVLTVSVVYSLLLFGFAMKAGIFPLGQLWLPDAHSVAPSPVSALLSGVMLKTGIYGLLRTFLWMVPEGRERVFDPLLWGGLLLGAGVVTLFLGTVQSMKQSDAKRLLAYSSIGQIGYIVFGLGTAVLLSSSESEAARFLALVALVGTGFHVLNHAVFKGLLFLSSGSVLYATGTRDLNRLGGLIGLMPVTAVFAGIASLAIAGIPPLSGFASKWTLVSSSFLGAREFWFLVPAGVFALFTSAMTLACYVKFFGMTFTSAGAEWNPGHAVREVPGTMLAAKAVLAALCVIQGLVPLIGFRIFEPVFQQSALMSGASTGAALTAGVWGVEWTVPGAGVISAAAMPLGVGLLLAGALALAAYLRRSGGAQERRVPTWLCGYQEINNNNRYLDRNLFAALRHIMRWTGGNPR